MSTPTGKALAKTGLTLGLGAAFGAPGYIIGGVLGTVLFPPEAPEPPDPYSELNLNTSSERVPVPLTYGVAKSKGNFMFKGTLRSKAVKSGGKGTGGEVTTGYKYWTDAAIGICKGIVDVTRMWKNDNIFVHENSAAVTVHRGTPEQTIDPDWDALADNVVPLKNLAYTFYNNFYLGKDNNSFPTISHETHRFPWTTTMEEVSPYVYNRVNENDYGGVIKKDKYDETIVANHQEVKVFDNDWQLKRTIDISALNITDNGPGAQQEWDMCISYLNGTTYLNFFVIHTGTTKQAIDVYRFAKGITEVRIDDPSVVRPNTTKRRLVDDEFINDLFADSNSQYIMLAYRGGTSPYWIQKLAVGNPFVSVARYDVTLAHGSMASPDAWTINEDFCFWMNPNNILTIFDFNGVMKDYKTSAFNGWGNSMRIEALYGGPHVIAVAFGVPTVGTSPYRDWLSFVTYDRLTALFETSAVDYLELNADWWDGDESPFREGQMTNISLEEGPDGTILISGKNYFSGDSATLQLIVDANPANIIYDLFQQARGFDITRVNTDALELVGKRAFDNRIGMSFSLIAKKNVGAVVRDVLGHLQGQVFRDNTGKFSFYMPSEDDVPVATVTLADVAAIQNGGAPDMAIIQTTNKDIGLCPNWFNVSYINRLNGYKQDATWQLNDMLAIDQDAEAVEEDLQYQMFSNPAVIAKLAWKGWKIGRLQNQMHEILLNGRWLWLQIGDVITLNIPEEDLVNRRVRIFSIDDPALDTGAAVKLTFQMDDDYLTSFEEIAYEPSLADDVSVGPPLEVQPIIWEEDARYNNDTYRIGITAIRQNSDTAWCDMYISLDAPDDFVFIGRMSQFANVGDLVNLIDDNDRTIVVNTDRYEGSTFVTYTRTNQRNNLSYCLIGTLTDNLGLNELEFMTYRESEVSGSDLVLKNCVRGKDYTLGKDHDPADGVLVLHVGMSYDTIGEEEGLNSMMVGKKVYMKLVPGNVRGETLSLDQVDYFEYEIQGYTRKATHTDRLEINDSVRGGLGRRTKTTDLDVEVVWEYTNRNDGMGKATLDAWEWHGWQPGDVDDYDVIVYQSDGVTVQAEHLGIGLVDNYTYTDAINAADFGGVASNDFWLGIRPVVTGRGPGRGVFDIRKQRVIRV